jgi:hypothetical protein
LAYTLSPVRSSGVVCATAEVVIREASERGDLCGCVNGQHD